MTQNGKQNVFLFSEKRTINGDSRNNVRTPRAEKNSTMALQPPDLDELVDDFFGRLGPNAQAVDAVAQRHEVLVFYRHEQFHVDVAA